MVDQEDLLPVAPHVALLQVAITEGNLAGVACVWVSRRGILHRGIAAATDSRHIEGANVVV